MYLYNYFIEYLSIKQNIYIYLYIYQNHDIIENELKM